MQCGSSISALSLASFFSKAALLTLVSCRYAIPWFNPLSQAEAGLTSSAGFNDILQSAVNSVVWPNNSFCWTMLMVYFCNRVVSSPLASSFLAGWSVSPVSMAGLPPSLAALSTFVSQTGEEDLKTATATAYSCASAATDVSQPWVDGHTTLPAAADADFKSFALVLYELFRVVAPMLPIAVGFSTFRRQERHGRVAVSDLHLPQGIFRSFLLILSLESAINIASMPSTRWAVLLEMSPITILLRYHWNWSLFVVLLVRMVYGMGIAVTAFPPVLAFTTAAVIVTVTLLLSRRRPKLLQSLLHAILSFGSLLALHRLSYVALARLTAIRAHQFAYALKKVASSVGNEYRYSPLAQTSPLGADARSRPLNGPQPKSLGKSAPAPRPINARLDSVDDTVSSLCTPIANRISLKAVHERRFTAPLIDRRMLSISAPAIESDPLNSQPDELRNEAFVPTGAARPRAHTKDITAAVVALSRGVIASTPLERLEQYKLATAGERRLRKVSVLVWSVLLVHATILATADLYTKGEDSENVSEDTMGLGNLSLFLSHTVHFLHVAYMWAFVQQRVQRAELGLIQAWEEVKLLHCRLPSSSIRKEEADDWLQFLRNKKDQSSPSWPARVLSALGILRFVLPALLIMDPSLSLKDNLLDVLKAFAVGGKYVIYRSKNH